jgi:hypothetical protein
MVEAAADFERPLIERILSRPVRDAAFRHAIQTTYDSTRAMTEIKLDYPYKLGLWLLPKADR